MGQRITIVTHTCLLVANKRERSSTPLNGSLSSDLATTEVLEPDERRNGTLDRRRTRQQATVTQDKALAVLERRGNLLLRRLHGVLERQVVHGVVERAAVLPQHLERLATARKDAPVRCVPGRDAIDVRARGVDCEMEGDEGRVVYD